MIRQLISQTLQFRILALSATPGGDAKVTFFSLSPLFLKYTVHTNTSSVIVCFFPFLVYFLQSVQSVVSNLLISHIELRSDESPDIRPYSHQRNVEKVVVPLGEILSAQQARYLQVGAIDIASSQSKNVLWSKKCN